MSQNPNIEPEMEHPAITPEEEAALEQERKEAYERELKPFRELKAKMEASSTDITDLQVALADVYEQILAGT